MPHSRWPSVNRTAQAVALVGIGGIYFSRGGLGEEACLQWSRNRRVHRRRLAEIKKVVEVVRCSGIRKAETTEMKNTLDPLQDAAKIVLQVADVPHLGRVGRNNNQRHAKPKLIVVLVRPRLKHRRNVVVPTSPIVPSNEYGGILPVARRVVASGVISDGIDNGCDPRRSLAAVDGMIRVLSSWRYPTYLRERAVGDVVQDIRRCRVDITIGLAFGPVWPCAHALQRNADVRE